jgi:hypothetical protein
MSNIPKRAEWHSKFFCGSQKFKFSDEPHFWTISLSDPKEFGQNSKAHSNPSPIHNFQLIKFPKFTNISISISIHLKIFTNINFFINITHKNPPTLDLYSQDDTITSYQFTSRIQILYIFNSQFSTYHAYRENPKNQITFASIEFY